MSRPRRNRSSDFRKGAHKLKQKLVPSKIRIVSGTVGGRNIAYNGDPLTRPMKQKTREAVFSLLGGKLPNTYAVDLFAGTGVLGIESISRGSVGATLFEYSRPTLNTILENLKLLKLDDISVLRNIDTVRWLNNLDVSSLDWPEIPWVIFCCPPYKLWTQEPDKICNGLRALFEASPTGSQLVCETDHTFDLPSHMSDMEWDTRDYTPAIVSLCRKTAE